MFYSTRTRIVFHVVLGVPVDMPGGARLAAAQDALDERLTAITGGVTRFNGSGTWTANSQQGDYTGPVERDYALTYMISVIPDEEDAKLAQIMAAVTGVVRRFALPVQHVHVARSVTEERIFSIGAAPETALSA